MNLKTVRSKIILFFVVGLLLCLPSIFVWAGLATPFGGRIVKTVPCLFSGGNILITQIPVTGPPLMILRPGISRLYAYYQPTPGSHILGTVFGTDVCIIFPFPPVVVPAPLISMIGTSGLAGMASTGSGGDSSDNSSNSGAGDPGQGETPASDQNQEPCADENSQSSAYTLANEGWRNNMYYLDGNRLIGVGHKIGVGETLNGKPIGSYLSDSEVRQLYENDLTTARNGAAAAAANHGVNWNDLSPTRQAVLTDMSFEMGSGCDKTGKCGDAGLSGFNNMWSAIVNEDWALAGKEVRGSNYTGARTERNSRAMETDDNSEINDRINDEPRARALCGE